MDPDHRKSFDVRRRQRTLVYVAMVLLKLNFVTQLFVKSEVYLQVLDLYSTPATNAKDAPPSPPPGSRPPPPPPPAVQPAAVSKPPPQQQPSAKLSTPAKPQPPPSQPGLPSPFAGTTYTAPKVCIVRINQPLLFIFDYFMSF